MIASYNFNVYTRHAYANSVYPSSNTSFTRTILLFTGVLALATTATTTLQQPYSMLATDRERHSNR